MVAIELYTIKTFSDINLFRLPTMFPNKIKDSLSQGYPLYYNKQKLSLKTDT